MDQDFRRVWKNNTERNVRNIIILHGIRDRTNCVWGVHAIRVLSISSARNQGVLIKPRCSCCAKRMPSFTEHMLMSFRRLEYKYVYRRALFAKRLPLWRALGDIYIYIIGLRCCSRVSNFSSRVPIRRDASCLFDPRPYEFGYKIIIKKMLSRRSAYFFKLLRLSWRFTPNI